MPITQGGSDSDQLEQLGARHVRTHQLGLAGFVDCVNGENGLGEIDADVQNGHGLPLPSELMELRNPIVALCCRQPQYAAAYRDGEVPFIR